MPTAPAATAAPSTAKQQFLDVFDREFQTTLRVLRAYPGDKLDLKPHKMCKSALELAWMFVMEHRLAETLMTTGLDMSAPRKPQTAPATMDEVLTELDAAHNTVVDIVRALDDDQLNGTTKFFVAPKTLGDIRKMDLLWMLLHDQIHHRGQFSIYLRMADARVPSIYGPTADEPWM